MKDARKQFYGRVLASLLPSRNVSVLVLAAGPTDKSVFESLGFGNVTFSNVDSHSGGAADFAPFPFSEQDAEALTFPDRSFDYVVIHAALHHCHSPHRALLEMYRVARKGAIAFEARDSATMRLLERLQFTETYETSAVYFNAGKTGGVRNGPLPNYIFRWTEREVEKTINCFAPHAVHGYIYRYGHDGPVFLRVPGRSAKKVLLQALYAAYRVGVKLFPRQQNLFAFTILKPELPAGSRPWIQWQDGRPRLDMAWGSATFGSPQNGNDDATGAGRGNELSAATDCPPLFPRGPAHDYKNERNITV